MNVGDRVTTTGVLKLSGRLVAIRERGANPAILQSTHQVKLDVPCQGLRFLWFDPADLKPESDTENGSPDDAWQS